MARDFGHRTRTGNLQPFAAACVLTGALLLPHVSPGPVLGGMLLAALIRWAWGRSARGRGA